MTHSLTMKILGFGMKQQDFGTILKARYHQMAIAKTAFARTMSAMDMNRTIAIFLHRNIFFALFAENLRISYYRLVFLTHFRLRKKPLYSLIELKTKKNLLDN